MEIKENVPLSKYTTLKIGGPAKFFCEVENEKEILEVVKFVEEKNLTVFVLGGGSNILISDEGFNGLVIKISNFKFQISNLRIICDSGCSLSTIVNESVKADLTGLEWAAGIPGTIGGAIRGNAGAFNGSMADIVQAVRVIEIRNPNFEIRNKSKIQVSNFPALPAGRQFPVSNKNSKPKTQNLKLQDCKFSYRSSIFKQNPNLIILSVNLKLKRGNKAEGEKKIKEILAQRKEKQPFDFPSSGSFFKNPIVRNERLIKEYETDTGNKTANNVIPAGYLIDRTGLRGKKIGGAMVSRGHGNFLVNTGKAKAEDFIILAAIIKTRVRNKFGIQLKEEVEIVGF